MAVIVGCNAISGGFGAIVIDLLRNILFIYLEFGCSLCQCCLAQEANILTHHTEEILFEL